MISKLEITFAIKPYLGWWYYDDSSIDFLLLNSIFNAIIIYTTTVSLQLSWLHLLQDRSPQKTRLPKPNWALQSLRGLPVLVENLYKWAPVNSHSIRAHFFQFWFWVKAERPKAKNTRVGNWSWSMVDCLLLCGRSHAKPLGRPLSGLNKQWVHKIWQQQVLII